MKIGLLTLAWLLTGATAFAASSDMPRRKSGLWEIKVTGAQAGGTHWFQQCVNEKTDDIMKNDAESMADMKCTTTSFRREGDRIIFESICKIDNSTAKTRSVISGRFDSAYKVESRSTYDPPMHGMRESSMQMDAKWLGACKSGQKAGDIVLPGMPNININELMQKMPKRP